MSDEDLTDEDLARFVTPAWLERVADVPIDEVPVMVCEDPSVVTALVGALRHARAELERAERLREQATRWRAQITTLSLAANLPRGVWSDLCRLDSDMAQALKERG